MRIFLLSLTLLIASCTTLPPQQLTTLQQLWQTNQANLQQIDNWHISGRIAVASKDEAWNLKVHWQQAMVEYNLRFYTPAGQGAMLLSGNDQYTVLKTGKNEKYEADNPDELMAKVLKVDLPVSDLHAWIRGLPATHSEPNLLELIPETGYLDYLEQGGWKINFKRYQSVNGVQLPNKIFLNNKDYQVRIVIDKWKTNINKNKEI